jgi:hypothetical protein
MAVGVNVYDTSGNLVLDSTKNVWSFAGSYDISAGQSRTVSLDPTLTYMNIRVIKYPIGGNGTNAASHSVTVGSSSAGSVYNVAFSGGGCNTRALVFVS